MKQSSIARLSLLLLISLSVVLSFDTIDMNEFLQGKGNLSIISNAGKNILNVHLTKEFSWDDYKLGLGVNIVIPERFRPPGLNLIEFRYAEYDNGKSGLRYGLLKGVTFGYGTLMDRYNSAPGISYFDQSRAGVKGYTHMFYPIFMKGMFTASKVVATRLSYEIGKVPVLNKPLSVGMTYAIDQNGVISGNTVINRGLNGVGFDVGVNVVPRLMDLFVEYVKLSNESHGYAAGLKFDLHENLAMKAEYRVLGHNFVPGIFNSTYEAVPVNMETYQSPSIKGYFAGFDYQLPGTGKISLGLSAYEHQTPVFKGGIGINNFMGYGGVVNYEQLLFSDEPYLITGTITYPINPATSAVIGFEKIGDREPSYTVGYQMSF